MYMNNDLDVQAREAICYQYFSDYNITNRDQLRQQLKVNPILGVTSGFAEEMLSDYNRKRRQNLSKRRISNKNKIIKTCVFNDVHIPYQDDVSLQLVFDCIVNEQPNYLILNGDILDFYGCSRFDKRPDRNVILQAEINTFYQLFSYLRKYIPNTEIHYNLGNHENRMITIMLQQPGLWDLDVLSFLMNLKRELLHLKNYYV